VKQRASAQFLEDAARTGKAASFCARMMVNYSHIIREDDRHLAAEFGRILRANACKSQEEALTVQTQGLMVQ
jgi:hypothetical protein